MDAEAAHTNSFSELLARELDKVIEIKVKPGCRGGSLQVHASRPDLSYDKHQK